MGKAIFRSNCAFCHVLNGRGGRGPNLVSKPVKDLKSVVRNGTWKAGHTWELKGRQYATMPSGSALITFALP